MKKILTEAEIKLSDLKSSRWNDAYFASGQEIKTAANNALYRIKLITKDKNADKNVLNPNNSSKGDNVRYLKLDLNAASVHAAINKEWLRKNANTANFSYSYTANDATLFELPSAGAVNSVEGEMLIKALKARKARKALSYNIAELERVEGHEAQNLSKENKGGILSDSGENISFDKTTLIKLYLTALFNKINNTELGKSVYGDYPCSGSNISSDANSFYNNYLNSPEVREVVLDRVKEPLWGNGILTIAAFLFAHGNKTTDLMTRALKINNALDHVTYETGIGRSCDGEAFILATNPGFNDFDSTEFAQTIQLMYNLLTRNGGSDVKNDRARLSSSDKPLAKALVAYLVGETNNFNAEQYEAMKKYLVGETEEKIDAAMVSSLCNAKLNEVSLKSFVNIRVEAQLVLLKDTNTVKNLYMVIEKPGKEANCYELEQGQGTVYNYPYDIKISSWNEIEKLIIKFVFAKNSPEAKSTKNISPIKAVEGLEEAKIIDGKVEVEVQKENVRALFKKFTFNTSNGALSFSNQGTEKEEPSSDDPWAEWEDDPDHGDRNSGKWETVAEENPTEKEG